MERTIEGTARLEASAGRAVELLSTAPAGVLTGWPSPNKELFVAEIAVEVGGGTSLAQEVDVFFGRLRNGGGVGRFGLSWRAREHGGLFPLFGGDLEVHPDGTGSVLRLAGRYTLPLWVLGAAGDGLVGHRFARRALQGFVEAAAGRIEAALAHEPMVSVPMPGPRSDLAPVEIHSEMFLG
jgi:hypothetical protein